MSNDLTYVEWLEANAKRVAAFRPLNGQVLVELEKPHAAYAGSIIIPETVEADVNGTRTAIIRAVGPGRKIEGSASGRCPMNVKVGDRVILDEILLRGPFPAISPGFHVCEEEQLLCVIEL